MSSDDREPRRTNAHDAAEVEWRQQIERGWLQAQAGTVVDGRVSGRAFDLIQRDDEGGITTQSAGSRKVENWFESGRDHRCKIGLACRCLTKLAQHRVEGLERDQ